MNDSGWIQDPRGKRPPLWARVVGFVTMLTVTVAIVAAGCYVGSAIDAALTTTLGPLESKLTGWTVLLTLLTCLWSRRRHRREI